MKPAKSVALVGAAVLVAYVGAARIIALRRDQATETCVENLCRIDGAKQQWALEDFATQDAEPTWFDIFFYGGRVCDDWPMHCPSGGSYVLGRVGDLPRCSIAHHTAAFQAKRPGPIAKIDSGSTLTTTAAYQQELLRLMIAEAERVAGELNGELKLDEQKPILETNVTIWPPILSVLFRGPIAGIRMPNCEYTMTMTVRDSGIVASGIARAGWPELWSETNQWDSNQVVQVASELLTSAGIDVGALNRDCDVSLDPWFRHRVDDPVHTVAWRQRQDTFFFRAAHVSADITFVVPAKLISNFAVHDSKYILKKPLETLDMVKLLTPENSREAVLDAVEAATNYVKRIRQLQAGGAPEPILRKVWLDYTTAPFRTNIFTGNSPLRTGVR